MYTSAVIGGGFFGCMAAIQLAQGREPVVLLEERSLLLERASRVNQARVHNGYHYPRSLPTATSSHRNSTRFAQRFAGGLEHNFTAVYAIAKRFSQVTACSFAHFLGRVGAPLRPAAPALSKRFDSGLIEAVFEVEEPAFNFGTVRRQLLAELGAAGVELRLGTAVENVGVASGSARLALCVRRPDGQPETLRARHVLNCTYARLNRVLVNSGLPLIPLRHEWTEMALVRLPRPLSRLAVTVMCGPFFSVVPYPSRPGLHTLSHVRYTPHFAWSDDPRLGVGEPAVAPPQRSNVRLMLRDAARYLPELAAAEYVESIWEVKTLLPRNDADDGRPILLRRDHGLPGLHCVLGAKLDNVFDLLDMLADLD